MRRFDVRRLRPRLVCFGALASGLAQARNAAPIALGALTAIGLLSALLADGGWDALSWLTLGVPVFACGWLGWRRSAPPQSPP